LDCAAIESNANSQTFVCGGEVYTAIHRGDVVQIYAGFPVSSYKAMDRSGNVIDVPAPILAKAKLFGWEIVIPGGSPCSGLTGYVVDGVLIVDKRALADAPCMEWLRLNIQHILSSEVDEAITLTAEPSFVKSLIGQTVDAEAIALLRREGSATVVAIKRIHTHGVNLLEAAAELNAVEVPA